MKRMHVSVKVADLGASVDFYSALFAAEPTVREADYAKWMLEDPRVNFSLVARGAEPGFDHLGIQAETPEELAELRERIGRAGGAVEEEGETVCCYHRSDKTWVTDAQGVGWEAFYTERREDVFAAGPAEGCCAGGCCAEPPADEAASVACCA
jgi:catechol 2,3-dioxygenase-like lactoylglutathione lyase family enzyme